MDYEIIDKKDCPPYTKMRGWRKLFDSISFNQAVKFPLDSKKKAQLLAQSIGGTLRRVRCDYGLSWRIVPENDKYILYIWKVEREEK